MARNAGMIIHMVLPATLLLLAGGDSRRMGRPKALLPVGGVSLIEWIAQRLGVEFESLLVAARDASQLPAGLRPRFVPDVHAGAGPLAGIDAGLAATPHDVLIAVACDMPWVSPALVRRLFAASDRHDAAVPRPAGRPEPACAAYRRSAAPAIRAALETGRWKAAEALAELRVRWLDEEDPASFANLNTPEEYRAFLEAVRKRDNPGEQATQTESL